MANSRMHRPITVVFVGRVPWAGGAERVVVDIARHLDPKRFLPVIVHLYDGPLPPPDIARGLKFKKLDSGMPPVHRLWKTLRPGTARSRDFLGSAMCNSRAFARDRLHGLLDSAKKAYSILGGLLVSLYRSMPSLLRDALSPVVCPFRKYLLESDGVSCASPKEQAYPEACTGLPSPKAASPCAPRPINIHRQAELIARYARSLRGTTVFVAVMEEAASALRLALGPNLKGLKPYIVQTHAWESYYLPIMYGCPGFDIDWERATFAKALQGAAAVTSPCQGCRDDLIEAFQSPPESTVTVSNPVDIAAIRKASQASLEKPLPRVCETSPMFLSVGRLDPQKNHNLLFEACAVLRDRGLDFTLVCLGDGHIRQELEDRLRDLDLQDRAFLLGGVKNPFPYMRRALAHVTASDSESFGMVIAETMACGSLTISLDCQHGPRELLDDGRAGLLVSPCTAEALAAAMEQALTDQEFVQEKIRNASSALVKYDTSAVVSRWEILLAHVAAQHGTIY